MIISAIIPCFQERNTIEPVLNQMIAQSCSTFELEILVVDGGSTDGTLEIIEKLQQKDPRIQVLHNSLKTANHAFNLGIHHSKGSHFALINAHTFYPPEYLEICWANMQKTKAVGVSGRVIPIPPTANFESQFIYAISTSPFGVSSQSYRMGKSGFTHSVSLPLFEKNTLVSLGLYHPQLARNQDNEMNYRLIHAGYKLYVTNETTASYHPPSTFLKLLKYAFKSGLWNTKTYLMGIPCMKLYHFIPGFFVLCQWMGGVFYAFQDFSPSFEVLGTFWIFINLIYWLLACFFSFFQQKSKGFHQIFLPFGFLLFHAFYGLGNLAGLAYKNKSPNF